MLLNRRHFLSLAVGTVSTFHPMWPRKSFADGQIRASSDAEAWMSQLMKRDKDVVGLLYFSRFADPIYFLLKPITWRPNSDRDALPSVTAPIGFVTDLASIPRAFWSLLRPDGNYAYAAILHDYMYWDQTLSRETADTILKRGMMDFDIDKTSMLAIYEAVRLFGQSAWDENARAKQKGEKRILSQFPSDPRITWSRWKSDSSHF